MALLLLKSCILGILTGSIYALMASGMTLIFGVMRIINVAQGIFVITGAYLSLVLERQLHIDPFLGLLITMPLLFLLGYGVQQSFIQNLKQNHFMLSILVMYAVAQIIEGILNVIFSPTSVQIHAWYIDKSLPLGFFYLPYVYLFCFLLSIVLLGMLYFLVYRTQFGFSLRAAVQNRTAASLIGINVNRVSAITFGIGVALAGAGGLAYGATNAFNAASSYDLIERLLVIIVLGGMGSLNGALIASVVMLIISDITDVTLGPVWSSTIFFLVLILLLLFRQQGLFGTAQGRTQ